MASRIGWWDLINTLTDFKEAIVPSHRTLIGEYLVMSFDQIAANWLWIGRFVTAFTCINECVGEQHHYRVNINNKQFNKMPKAAIGIMNNYMYVSIKCSTIIIIINRRICKYLYWIPSKMKLSIQGKHHGILVIRHQLETLTNQAQHQKNTHFCQKLVLKCLAHRTTNWVFIFSSKAL